LAAQANPFDSTRTVNDRVRSYLHGNCAHCHNTLYGLCGDWRYFTDLADAGVCAHISPGDPLNSMVYQRIVDRAPIGPMPQVGTFVTDPLITDLLYKWIEDLDSCP
jgi:hypothetical protein